jgi:hypothetical protein
VPDYLDFLQVFVDYKEFQKCLYRSVKLFIRRKDDKKSSTMSTTPTPEVVDAVEEIVTKNQTIQGLPFG